MPVTATTPPSAPAAGLAALSATATYAKTAPSPLNVRPPSADTVIETLAAAAAGGATHLSVDAS